MKTITKVTMEIVSFYSHSAAYMAPLCMFLAPVGALDGTRGRAVAQQASASHCKGVHLTTPPH